MGAIVDTPEEAAAQEREPLLVRRPLEAFLDAHGLGSGPVAATEIGDGHSNVTFRLERADVTCVLRRPPRGPLPPSAHDVLREARLLRALEPTPVRSPPVLATCDDEAVIGAPFYLMPVVEGDVLVAALPAHLRPLRERVRVAHELVDGLVEIHAVDPASLALERFGRPTGYLERQLERFTGLWAHNATRAVGRLDDVTRWLGEHLPSSPPSTLVHGDYRLGNVMYAPAAPARVAAVLDWEMATIGDPLADLGYLLAVWAEPGDPDAEVALNPVTREPGFPTRAELADRYAERSGRTVGDLRFYTALALWKSAIFLEGSYKRRLAGTTDDPYFDRMQTGVPQLAERAWEAAHHDP